MIHCDEEMKLLSTPIVDSQSVEERLYVCLVCGMLYTERLFSIDDEELQDLKDNYPEELKELKIDGGKL